MQMLTMPLKALILLLSPIINIHILKHRLVLIPWMFHVPRSHRLLKRRDEMQLITYTAIVDVLHGCCQVYPILLLLEVFVPIW